MVINIAKTTFMWTFGISLVLSVLNGLATKHKEISKYEDPEKKTTPLKVCILVIVVIATLAIIIGGIFLVGFEYKILAWILLVACIPFYLSYITGTFISIGIVRNVVQSGTKKPLSEKENLAIQTISYTLYFVDACKLPSKLMEYLKSLENIIVSDMLYILSYVILLFLYSFFVCALLLVPLAVLSKIMINLNAVIRDKTRLFKVGNFFIKQIDRSNLKDLLSLKIIEWSKLRCRLLYIITLIFIPILIGVDVSLIVLRVLYSFLLEAIGYVFLFLKVIKKAFGKTIVWISNLSDRHLVATSFRVALIITLALTVAINRYTPLLRSYEASTGVLEFVAGTILIPVIFEWIASNKAKQNKCKNEN